MIAVVELITQFAMNNWIIIAILGLMANYCIDNDTKYALFYGDEVMKALSYLVYYICFGLGFFIMNGYLDTVIMNSGVFIDSNGIVLLILAIIHIWLNVDKTGISGDIWIYESNYLACSQFSLTAAIVILPFLLSHIGAS